MRDKETIKKLRGIIKEYDSGINLLTDDEFLKYDSLNDLSKIQVAMEIERKFEVDFEFQDVYEVVSVEKLIEIIKNKQDK